MRWLLLCIGGCGAYITADELERRQDLDGDGYPNAQFGGSDCNDGDGTVHPGAEDVFYDGVDSDCGGDSDYDADGDGFDSDAHGGDDCDDADPEVNPDAFDAPYDGLDPDCSGGSDFDADGDGFDSADHGGDDCDDTEATTFPGADDPPYDGVDSACDGDEREHDVDGDGVNVDTDCDDRDPSVYPGAPGDVPYDGIDTDCDGGEECDEDGDGYLADSSHGAGACMGYDCDDRDDRVHPGADEVLLNGVDEDCDPNALD